MSETDCPPADPHAAAVARAERRLAMLGELAQIGMDMARDLGRQAAQLPAPDAAAPPRDPAESFARLSRAIRLTLTLEARTDRDFAALRAGVATEIETHREAEARTGSGDRRAAVERAVREALDAEIPDPDERFERRELLRRHLRHDEAYADLESMSLAEAVQRLCADLGLAPDWRRWSEAGWKPDNRPIVADCENASPEAPGAWPSG